MINFILSIDSTSYGGKNTNFHLIIEENDVDWFKKLINRYGGSYIQYKKLETEDTSSMKKIIVDKEFKQNCEIFGLIP